MCVVSRRCGSVWGPKEALILTVLETEAPKTTPDDVDREEGTQNMAEKKKQDSTWGGYDTRIR